MTIPKTAVVTIVLKRAAKMLLPVTEAISPDLHGARVATPDRESASPMGLTPLADAAVARVAALTLKSLVGRCFRDDRGVEKRCEPISSET